VVGFATTALPVVALKPVAGLHAKVEALLVAVKVKVVCPLQIAPAPLTEMVGVVITFIVPVAVAVHVFTSVAFTVYVVGLAGLSLGAVEWLPVIPPPVHVYVLAPLTPKVAGPAPLQILADVTVKVGGVFTVIVAVAVFVQVFTSIAFTVYTVVLAGLSVGFVVVFPFMPPPAHV
jgi:hypothetical protein